VLCTHDERAFCPRDEHAKGTHCGCDLKKIKNCADKS